MYIKVKITPGAKNESLTQIKENQFDISVKEKPKNNAVNNRILEMMNIHFGNPAGGCKIVSGHHHRVKLLKIGNE